MISSESGCFGALDEIVLFHGDSAEKGRQFPGRLFPRTPSALRISSTSPPAEEDSATSSSKPSVFGSTGPSPHAAAKKIMARREIMSVGILAQQRRWRTSIVPFLDGF